MKKLYALSIMLILVGVFMPCGAAFADPQVGVPNDRLESIIYTMNPKHIDNGIYLVNLTELETDWQARALGKKTAEGESEEWYMETNFKELVVRAIAYWSLTLPEREIVSITPMAGFGRFGREMPGITTGLVIITRLNPDARRWGPVNEGN